MQLNVNSNRIFVKKKPVDEQTPQWTLLGAYFNLRPFNWNVQTFTSRFDRRLCRRSSWRRDWLA